MINILLYDFKGIDDIGEFLQIGMHNQPPQLDFYGQQQQKQQKSSAQGSSGRPNRMAPMKGKGKRLRENDDDDDDDEDAKKSKLIKTHLDLVISNLENTVKSIKSLRDLL